MKYYVEVFMSASPTTNEIEPKRTNPNLQIDLHGPICELLELHNFANSTQVSLCFANLLSLPHLLVRKTRGKKPLLDCD